MMRRAYRQGMVHALLEKLAGPVFVTPEGGRHGRLGLLAGAGLGGLGALGLKGLMRGAMRGRSPKSKAIWGGLGLLGALGLGGYVGKKALE